MPLIIVPFAGREMNHPTWNPNHAQILAEMWPNFSASYIARHLNETYGCKYSRNAVIGKAGRMKLQKPLKQRTGINPPPKKKERTQVAAKPKRFVMVKPIEFDYHPPRVIVAQEAWDPLPDNNPINIMKLNSKTCRWPVDVVDSNEQMFCGAPCNVIYCASHMAVNVRQNTMSSKNFMQMMRRYL